MTPEKVKKLIPFERFLYWIRERDTIHLRRNAGDPKPWTDDPILQQYRFCNVRRMDDRVSCWLYEHWYRPHKDHRNILMACAMARMFNLPDTLAEVGFPRVWQPEHLKAKLHRRQDAGLQVFNGAYIVSTSGAKMSKIDCVVDRYLHPLYVNPVSIDTDSMQRTHAALNGRYGFASFLAGQVVADLRWGMSGTWTDARTWAPKGPGSVRGMRRLSGDRVEGRECQPIPDGQFQERLLQVMEMGNMKLPHRITLRMEAIDWQNCLCEFDKYERALWGHGRPKAKYPGV